MRTATLDRLIWVLIFGGLLLLSLGLFVSGGQGLLRLLLVGGGAAAAVAGVVLVAVRARRPE